MNLSERIDLLAELGRKLESEGEDLQHAIEQAYYHNNWFTADNIDQALNAIKREFLDAEKLHKWASAYDLSDNNTGKNVAVIMAGNIPLVGFHDLLCVFISGHNARIKMSSKDEVLTRYIIDEMKAIAPEAEKLIELVERVNAMDAVIATGSNNSFRYFEHYFGMISNLIRKNRNSLAVMSGYETREDLDALAFDIQSYFGLGCRNVSKIFVPGGYDFAELISVLDENQSLKMHHKYMNNYDYNLAVSLVNCDDILQGENAIIRKSVEYISSIAMINYEEYRELGKVKNRLETDIDQLQIVVTSAGDLLGLKSETRFGESQKPGLGDYADRVDTMEFLCGLS